MEGDDKTLHLDSLKESSERLSIDIKTAFFMRHKIMLALNAAAEEVIAKGNIQADETFILTSHKGTNSLDNKEIVEKTVTKKRGLSNHQTCLICLLDNKGNVFVRSNNVENASHEDAMILDSHIEKGSHITTDGTNLYNVIVENKSLFQKKIEDCKTEEGLERISSLHAQIKFLNWKMRGVATKYLNRYCNIFMFRWDLVSKKAEEIIEKAMELIKKGNPYHSIYSVQEENLFNSRNLVYARKVQKSAI